MKQFFSVLISIFMLTDVHCQVDSSMLFNTRTPFGTLDIRLSKGNGHYYYLKRDKTFSFRQDDKGRTDTYLKMTAWDSEPYGEGHLRERSDGADRFVMNYRLLVPQGYDAALAEGYPLVVVMHGFLERGNCAGTDCYHGSPSYSPNENAPPAPTDSNHALLNNDYNLVHAGSNYLDAHLRNGSRIPSDGSRPPDAFPGFVLFPQNLNGWDGSASEDVIRLIRLLQLQYNIDEDRIYLNGISHGGHGAYEVMKRAPWMFAAAALFSAADDGGVVRQKLAGDIARIPLWIFQGALDVNPTQSATEEYISSFKKAGAVVRYTLYPNIGHGTWNKALSEPDFFTWMLSKKRTDLHVFAGNATICPTSSTGTALSLPTGFTAYEWEYNGERLDGAHGKTFNARAPGTYRGRYKKGSGASAQWSAWSSPVRLAESNPPKAEIHQVGTVLLPDLNGNQAAVLESSGNHAYYFWRNGDLPASAPHAGHSKRLSLSAAGGNAALSLIVAGYDQCQSALSDKKYVYFNNSARMALQPPYGVTLTAVSPAEVHLAWSDATSGEKGFEIWRRKIEGGDSLLWEMIALTGRDATAFSDRSVSPSSTYDYKIRAVNDTERSDYAPKIGTRLVVSTSPDREPPAAPQNVSALKSGVKSIRLTWNAATDNAAVSRYIVSFNGDTTSTTDTTYTLSMLAVNTVYRLEVRAVDAAGNIGPSSNPTEGDTFLSGLYYTHSTGAWQTLGEIDWSVQEFSGVVDDFTLAPKTQEDFFNFTFDGYLSIGKAGVYQFRMTSDDGSTLSLNDTLLIENDGVHNMHTVMGPIQILDRGPQRLTVRYFDYVMSDTLLIEYKGPDTGKEWTKIPPHVLTSEVITATTEDEADAEELMIYPNPAIGHVNVGLLSQQDGLWKVNIFDMAGRNIFGNDAVELKDHLRIHLPHDIQPGMYFVFISQGSKMFRRKFVIR